MLLAMPAVAQQALVPRWELEVRGPIIAEEGDLRLAPGRNRIVFQHGDSAFEAVTDFRADDSTGVHFAVPAEGWVFDGVLMRAESRMHGTVHTATGDTLSWRAWSLPYDNGRFPVPPKIRVRELMLGTTATSERIPGQWLALLTDSSALERDYTALARAAGMTPVAGTARTDRSRLMQLGLDPEARAASRRMLATIAAGPAADPEFLQLFQRGSGWRIDLHEEMLDQAPHALVRFDLMTAAAGLRRMGELRTGTDSLAIFESGWRLWCREQSDSSEVRMRLDTLARVDSYAAVAVRAMLASYSSAEEWWRRAVNWLLRHAWIETSDGYRSPQQLFAAFWSATDLPLPQLRPTRFGAAGAMPLLQGIQMAPYLLEPANAVAQEWLASPDPAGRYAAMAGWLSLAWGDPLRVDLDGRRLELVSPHAVSVARPAAFFAPSDGIAIDPGIMPMAAVATFLHEWHHLMARKGRLAGTHPAGLTIDARNVVHLFEDDSWLSEGFAEWATDVTLHSVRGAGSLLLFTQAEKRLGTADHDDPHLLGYRLVRAAALRVGNQVQVRETLVRAMHDLPAVARQWGLAGPGRIPFRNLARPANASVIPEITFTWDDDAVLDLTRRLILTTTRTEH